MNHCTVFGHNSAKSNDCDILKANHDLKLTANANFTKGYNSAIFRHTMLKSDIVRSS